MNLLHLWVHIYSTINIRQNDTPSVVAINVNSNPPCSIPSTSIPPLPAATAPRLALLTLFASFFNTFLFIGLLFASEAARIGASYSGISFVRRRRFGVRGRVLVGSGPTTLGDKDRLRGIRGIRSSDSIWFLQCSLNYFPSSDGTNDLPIFVH